jgi:hypothetical protein
MSRLSKYVAVAAFSVIGVSVPVGVRAADTSRDDKVQYKDVVRDDMPKDVRHAADDQTKGAKDVSYQRQIRDGKTFYGVQYTKDGKRYEVRLDEKGKVVDGPHAARDQDKSGTGSSKSGDKDGDVEYHRISERDVAREIPKPALDELTRHVPKDAHDLIYQRQIRDGQRFYSVHYTTKDNKEMFVRVEDNGKLAVGPTLSDKQEGTGGTTASRDSKTSKTPGTGTPTAEVKREELTAFQLPANVRKAVEDATAGGSDHKFVKETIGNDTTYFVEYTKNGQRSNIRVNSAGQFIPPSPSHTHKASPPPPTPQTDAHLAAAKLASGPYQALSGADQLPAEVRRAIETAAPGATDSLFQRFTENGQTIYTAHVTNAKGAREFLAVDQTGKVVIQPRKSAWQEGGKNVKYEVIGADQLPAEARTEIEQATAGGSAHVFLARTAGDRKTYLVQYTAAGGERMEAEVGPKGKLLEKPRKAQDDPFTVLERKADKKK